MTNLKLIQRYLPQHLWKYASKFSIPEDFLEEDPKLIELILESKAIESDEEKQNWLNLLLLMTDEQLKKLREILIKERNKLQEIEEKYEKKKLAIKKKYLAKWQRMGYIKKIKEIQYKEAKEKAKEQEEAERILEML